MQDRIIALDSPLFYGIQADNMGSMLHCTGYQLSRYKKGQEAPLPCGCPGTACQSIPQEEAPAARVPSRLRNFPIQLKLVPASAPYFQGADLLIAADCTAYACGSFHEEFIRNRVTLIGCPKLDSVDYAIKLRQILESNHIRSITVTRMTVPCCGGLPYAVKTALEQSGKDIPLTVVTIAPHGTILC